MSPDKHYWSDNTLIYEDHAGSLRVLKTEEKLSDRQKSIIAEAFDECHRTGKTPKELAEILKKNTERFVVISNLLSRFTNGTIQMAKHLADHEEVEGFHYFNPLYDENKALSERVKQLEKELDQYRSAVHRANFG